MNIKNHSNINAVALVVESFESIRKHLRGKAGSSDRTIDTSLKVCNDLIQEFAVQVSTRLDETFGAK